MAPLLIDSKDLIKYGFISVFVAASVFVGGFLSGYQQAASFYLAGSDIQTLLLPEKTLDNVLEAELQLPKIIEAGEEIDVDQPEKLAQKDLPVLSNKLNNKADESSKSVNIKQTQSQVVAPAKNGAKKSLDVKALVSKSMRSAAMSSDIAATKTATTAIETEGNKVDVKQKGETAFVVNKMVASNTFKAPELTAEELEKIKYSIQVGMYGRLVNAENMMQMLHAQQFNAYITDYINKKNEIRYNVRFGYFSDKKSAINKLKTFKNEQKGDGYLVKFTSENIVNLADAKELNVVDDIDAEEKKSLPANNSSDVSADNISQLMFTGQAVIVPN